MKLDYDERCRLQAENQWLYRHCLENSQLKAHIDACDRVALLFAETPLEGAVLHPLLSHMQRGWAQAEEWHTHAYAYVNEHRYMFVALWLFLFLALPRLFLGRTPIFKQERLRAAAAVSIEPQPRQRRRCIV